MDLICPEASPAPGKIVAGNLILTDERAHFAPVTPMLMQNAAGIIHLQRRGKHANAAFFRQLQDRGLRLLAAQEYDARRIEHFRGADDLGIEKAGEQNVRLGAEREHVAEHIAGIGGGDLRVRMGRGGARLAGEKGCHFVDFHVSCSPSDRKYPSLTLY